MAYGRACYGWAVKRGRLLSNPFAALPAIAGGAPSRDRVLTDEEVGGIWRSAGSLAWAGLGNTYFWIDPKRRVAGVILMQHLPFADGPALQAFAGFETAIYQGLRAT